MPCSNPLQASRSLQFNGKMKLVFNSPIAIGARKTFRSHGDMSIYKGWIQSVPCGRCTNCRLEQSREWAVRIMHEASLYEDNCFITLTYSPEKVPKDGSLNHKDFQDFMKKFRQAIIPKSYHSRKMVSVRKQWVKDNPIRYFMCGEYGEDLGRPHFHACIFNYDFPDKVYYKTSNGNKLWTSKMLEDIWGHGFAPIGSLTFDSAAYVARYVTKKITGPIAEDHYSGRKPEYGRPSNRRGIGLGWYEKWKKDCFPSDYLIVNGVKSKVPRYYDKQLEKTDPDLLKKLKLARRERAEVKEDDNTYARLLVKEQCLEARLKPLVRKLERGSYVDEVI